MPHFWLSYRDAGRLVGVVIVESTSLIQARLNAAVGGVDAGATFAEGHELGSDLMVLVAQRRLVGCSREKKRKSYWPASKAANLAGPKNDNPPLPAALACRQDARRLCRP
jgi:hypothetical protein